MKILMFAALLSLCSCSWFDEFADKRMPIDNATKIAAAVQRVLVASDLNQDGAIQGKDEWVEFARQLILEIRANT